MSKAFTGQKMEEPKQSREEVQAQVDKDAEFVLELDKLPKQEHRWTNRGLKFTCEGANHPYHEYWPRRVASM